MSRLKRKNDWLDETIIKKAQKLFQVKSETVDSFMKDNVVKNKSFAFAIKIVKRYKSLCEQKKEFIISKQLLRSGTSIGANVREQLSIVNYQLTTREIPRTPYSIQALSSSMPTCLKASLTLVSFRAISLSAFSTRSSLSSSSLAF